MLLSISARTLADQHERMPTFQRIINRLATPDFRDIFAVVDLSHEDIDPAAVWIDLSKCPGPQPASEERRRFQRPLWPA